jgi:hypothetical protein
VVKLFQNKKLLYRNCKLNYVRWKDLKGLPNTMQDPRYTMHNAGDSIYPFALSLSKCGHLQSSLNVVAIFGSPEKDSVKASLLLSS